MADDNPERGQKLGVLAYRTIGPVAETKPMGRTTKAITIIVALGVLAFFLFAPVSFWFTETAGPVGYTSSVPVYRSFGCATIGYGDLYSPDWFGFSFGCSIPVPLPF